MLMPRFQRHPDAILAHTYPLRLICPNSTSRHIKPVTRHAAPILSHEVLARLLRVGGAGEEHTFVAGGLFVFADAAGLSPKRQLRSTHIGGVGSVGGRTLGLEAASAAGFTSAARLLGCIAPVTASGMV